jgi:hypothetical protein
MTIDETAEKIPEKKFQNEALQSIYDTVQNLDSAIRSSLSSGPFVGRTWVDRFGNCVIPLSLASKTFNSENEIPEDKALRIDEIENEIRIKINAVRSKIASGTQDDATEDERNELILKVDEIKYILQSL